MKHLLTLRDISPEEFLALLKRAAEMKAKPAGLAGVLKNKTVGMVFFKKSTRTRVSFAAGISYLGATPLHFGADDLQLSRGEPIKDTARVLSSYLSALVIRTFKQTDLEELAEYGTIPVINALTDLYHPCQALADYMTVQEHFGQDRKVKLVWLGDANNVFNSLMFGAALAGHHCVFVGPKGYQPDPTLLAAGKQMANNTGARIEVSDDMASAAKGAQVVVTDVWASMGQEQEAAKRHTAFSPYQVNAKLMAMADQDAIFMHCLPAHREEEVTEEVFESPQSVVWQEAENRMWTQMALMEQLIG